MKTLVIALLALAAAQQPTLLRRSFQADAVDTYKVEEKVSETVKAPTGDVPVNLAVSKTLAVKTLKVDSAAGTAQFEATTTVDKQTGEGQLAGMMADKPAPTTQTGKIDLRGRVTLDKVAPTADGMSALLSGSTGPDLASRFVELPERAVKPGDTWEIVVPKSPLMNADTDQKLVAKLEGEREVDGVPVWVVSIKGDLSVAVDSTKMPPSKTLATAVRVTGMIGLTGEGLVEKATGRTLSMTTKGVSKTNLELTDLGLSIEAQGTVDSTTKLQKPTG